MEAIITKSVEVFYFHHDKLTEAKE
jgi:hypothetical protein